jgi:cell wall-associated NlpC family hydrolase
MKPIYFILPLASLTMISCGLMNKLSMPVHASSVPNIPSQKEPFSPVKKNQETIEVSVPEVLTVPSHDNEISNVPVIGPEMFYPSQFKYSILMDVPVEEMVNTPLIDFMDKWYGTRYHMGGMDSTGMDCSGFATTYYKNFYGIILPRTSGEQYSKSKKISRSELQEGDLVFFHINRRKAVSHVGVYLRNNKFIHASTNKGVVISSLEDDFYNAHFVSGGRFPDLINSEVSR